MTIPHLILFDCDGTLLDSHRHIIAVTQEAFAQCGMPYPVSAEVGRVIGLSLNAAVARLLPDANDAERRQVADTYRSLYRGLPVACGLHQGVRSTLKGLRRRGYRLGIVTGKSSAGLQRALVTHKLHDFFLVWRTADQCPSKPHPAMVQECMEEMGVDGRQTTVVGDACCDMQMAKASGVRALGVSFGASSPDELLAAGATDVVDRFDALLGYFPHLPRMALCSTMAGTSDPRERA